MIAAPLFDGKIRYDKETKSGSVTDVITLITGQSASNAGKTFERLDASLRSQCQRLRINKEGRPLLMANASTLIRIIWDLPGKAAKEFRRECADYICRILGADETLIKEMEIRTMRTSPKQKEFFMADIKVPEIPKPTDEEKEVMIRKRKFELDILEEELRSKKRLNDIEIQRKELELRRQEKIVSAEEVKLYDEMSDLKVIYTDAHLRMAVKDAILMRLSGNPKTKDPDWCPDFTQIVHRLGHRRLNNKELMKMGLVISDSHLAEFGFRPDKADKNVNNAIRKVNVFPIEKQEWVTDQIKEYLQIK